MKEHHQNMRKFLSILILLISLSFAWLTTSSMHSMASSIIGCNVTTTDGIVSVDCDPACGAENFCHYYGQWSGKHYCTCVNKDSLVESCTVTKSDDNQFIPTCKPGCGPGKFCQYYGHWDGANHCSCLKYGPLRPCASVDTEGEDVTGTCNPACPKGSTCKPHGAVNNKVYCYCDNFPYSNYSE